MAGWYDSRNNKLDVDSSKVSTTGALTAKAVGDAFMGVAGVFEDRKKLDMLEADNKLKKEKTELDLSKAYKEETQKAIDDTYLGYVDTNTGNFNQEQFDKDNVGLPVNQVSIDAKLKQEQLKNAYALDIEKIDKKAQEEISNEVVKEMFKYGSKEEFNKNVNPDLIRYTNGTTMLAVDKFYNDAAMDEARLANAAAKLENAATIAGLKVDVKNKELDLKEKELELKSNKPKEVKAADDSLIGKNIVGFFGGAYDPVTEKIVGLDKDTTMKVSKIAAKASKYFKENKDMTHNEATALAIKDYEESVKKPDAINNKASTPSKEIEDPFGWMNKKVAD